MPDNQVGNVVLAVTQCLQDGDYREAMLLQQEYACWRAELRLDPDPRHYLMLARWEELARQHCGSMLIGQIEGSDEGAPKELNPPE